MVNGCALNLCVLKVRFKIMDVLVGFFTCIVPVYLVSFPLAYKRTHTYKRREKTLKSLYQGWSRTEPRWNLLCNDICAAPRFPSLSK